MNKGKKQKNSVAWLQHLPEKDTRWINEFKRYFGQLLKEERNKRNYNQQAVARDTNISIGTLSETESGTYVFNIGLYAVIAHYYGLELNTILANWLYSYNNSL